MKDFRDHNRLVYVLGCYSCSTGIIGSRVCFLKDSSHIYKEPPFSKVPSREYAVAGGFYGIHMTLGRCRGRMTADTLLSSTLLLMLSSAAYLISLIQGTLCKQYRRPVKKT